MPELYLQPTKPESLKNRSQALGGAGIESTAEETLLLAEALKWTNMRLNAGSAVSLPLRAAI